MRLQALLGIVVFLTIAWVVSENRKSVRMSAIVSGVALQFAVAAILLYVPLFKRVFLFLNNLVLAVDSATRSGTSFVFGYLGGGPSPFAVQDPGANFVFAFQALPLVLVIGALSSLLFYWRILPYIVEGFSFVLRNATILKGVIPDPLGHILVASFIHVAAAITVARIMVPETEAATAGSFLPQRSATSSMDGIVRGTMDGLHLLLNIVAMLIVMIALVHLTNALIGFVPVAGRPLTLQRILGLIMSPIVWLFGIPWPQVQTAGTLMGTKTILNELLAFIDMARLPAGALDDRSRLIMTYALTSFANFGSLGILIGGLGSLVVERRDEVVSLGLKAILAGTLATCMTGSVIGLLL